MSEPKGIRKRIYNVVQCEKEKEKEPTHELIGIEYCLGMCTYSEIVNGEIYCLYKRKGVNSG